MKIAILAAALAIMPAGLSALDDAAAPGKEISMDSQREKHVFAHYMVCFTAPVEFYKREIELAQRHGIEGFALNCGEWLKPDGSKTHYVTSAERIFQAAKELNSGFKLFLSPDFACEGINKQAEQNVPDMLRRFYEHPNLFRYKGVAVLSGYAGSQEQYAKASEILKKEGYKFLLVPKTSDNGRYAMAWSFETVIRDLASQSHIDGLFNFTCDGTAADLMKSNSMGRRGTLFLDKIFMAGACPAYNSPNLRDFQGMHGYCAMWEGIIRDSADWVEIVTWNDYQEDSNLMPFSWPGDKTHFDRDEAYLDVTSYYASWFRTGVAPEIAQDRLYFTYRARSKDQTQVWDSSKKAWVDIRLCEWPYEQIHDDVRDFVYASAFLTAPATLRCKSGDASESFSLPKGVSHVKIPLKPGSPEFKLERDGKAVVDVSGRKQVVDKPDELNSVKGSRLAYRTWTSAALGGEGVKLDAASAELLGSASKTTQGIALDGSAGCGAAFKLPALKTASYEIRIRYSNPSGKESRLTLSSDGTVDSGVTSGPGALGYCVPAFLPATAEGEFKTVSLLWSLYERSSKLQIASLAAKDKHPSDAGGAILKSLELVEAKPFVASAPKPSPDLVEIPGGSFAMGFDPKRPDETPSHKVSISPFAIGRFEVTNEEFELFMPKHKSYRDSFSWRDREPVIYVSWANAAKYCNWLSEKNGLRKVYDEKTWEADFSADGFRLPTEAEWEYVASGRGENRIYPWGSSEPVPGVNGNFALEKSLDIPAATRSSQEEGVAVVGSYPAGASRDGVMDMAGNVSEWCSDFFNDYEPGDANNPVSKKPSHHRVIRGGSWGYYNFSQRCQDREFNNPGYPGYIYVGFRVALPESGLEKLKAAKAKP